MVVGYIDGSVNIFDYNDNKLISKFNPHKSKITIIISDFSNSTINLYTSSDDNSIAWINLSLNSWIYRLKGHKDKINDILLFTHQLQKFLMSCSNDKSLRIWNLN